MPTQFQIFKSTLADNREGKDETGRRGRWYTTTSMQHGRKDSFLGLTFPGNYHPSNRKQFRGRGVRCLVNSFYYSITGVRGRRHGQPLMPCHPAKAKKTTQEGVIDAE